VESALHYRCPSGRRGGEHHLRDAVNVGKQRWVTARELAHDVPAECLQFVPVSLTFEESHLRTSSAGGCRAASSPDLSANSCRRF
jgi:hypothetical protein